MQYTKTTWADLPATTSPINASNLNKIENQLEALTNAIYPVGSIYISVNNTDPATLFGGTWEQIKDTMLMTAGDTYTAGNTGGSATHNHGLSNGYADITLNWQSSDSTNRLIMKTKDVNFIGDLVTRGDVGAYDSTSLGAWRPAQLEGTTDNASNLPPYLVVYAWKRTA